MAVSVYNYYFHDLPPALEHIRMDPQYAFGKFSKPVFPIPSKSVLKLSRLTDMMDSEEVKKKIEFEFSE